jgi:uncharacterized protein YndB with AHSA1/START domain
VLAEEAVAEGEMVEIQRRFPVGRDALFHAWTDAEALRAWFGPEGVTTRRAEVDLRVGGKFHVEMVTPDGSVIVHNGLYEEIVSPKKLVFTWLLQDQACEGSAGEHVETRVTIRFGIVDEETTDLYLLHEGLPSQKARDGHAFGWNGCFDCLDRYVISAVSGE